MSTRYRWLARAYGLATLATASVASAVTLNPLLPSSTPTGTGASATFLQISNSWTGSTALWNGSTYGTGSPIGATWGNSWGTGMWSLGDAASARSGAVQTIAAWSGVVSTINYGDGCYNSAHSGTWGAATLAPIFSSGLGCASLDVASAAANAQDNWLSYFTGYIRITEADAYNFSVLYDDGFFFNLYGADGTQSIFDDYLNPRNRLGFNYDLSLLPGLYRYELGAFDRLQAGVVDLRWCRTRNCQWTLIPPEYLVSVPEPASAGLMGLALAGLLLLRRRRAAALLRTRHAA